jgi:hypothetical protein
MTMFIGDPSALLAQQQQNILELHSKRAELQRWMQEMPSDQLAILIQLLHDIYEAHNSEVAAAYHFGQASAVMATKHDKCICGKDHAQEMLEEEAAKLAQHEADPLQDTMDHWNLNRAIEGDGFKCRECSAYYASIGSRAASARCKTCDWKPNSHPAREV